MHRLPLHAPSFLQRHDISISRAFDWFAGDSCERTNSCFTQSSPVHARTPKMPPLCVCLCVGLRDVVMHSGEMRAAVPFHVRFASSTHSLFSLFSLTLPHRMPYRNCPGDAGRIDSRRLPIRCVLLQLSHQPNSRNAKMFVMKTDDVRCVAISTPFHRFYL